MIPDITKFHVVASDIETTSSTLETEENLSVYEDEKIPGNKIDIDPAGITATGGDIL